MKHGNQLQSLASDVVRDDDVGGIWNDELASPENSSRAAHLRVPLKKVNGFENTAGYGGYVLF
jgi:hypothetical protein